MDVFFLFIRATYFADSIVDSLVLVCARHWSLFRVCIHTHQNEALSHTHTHTNKLSSIVTIIFIIITTYYCQSLHRIRIFSRVGLNSSALYCFFFFHTYRRCVYFEWNIKNQFMLIWYVLSWNASAESKMRFSLSLFFPLCLGYVCVCSFGRHTFIRRFCARLFFRAISSSCALYWDKCLCVCVYRIPYHMNCNTIQV